jgi:hypothetical protein
MARAGFMAVVSEQVGRRSASMAQVQSNRGVVKNHVSNRAMAWVCAILFYFHILAILLCSSLNH